MHKFLSYQIWGKRERSRRKTCYSEKRKIQQPPIRKIGCKNGWLAKSSDKAAALYTLRSISDSFKLDFVKDVLKASYLCIETNGFIESSTVD